MRVRHKGALESRTNGEAPLWWVGVGEGGEQGWRNCPEASCAQQPGVGTKGVLWSLKHPPSLIFWKRKGSFQGRFIPSNSLKWERVKPRMVFAGTWAVMEASTKAGRRREREKRS